METRTFGFARLRDGQRQFLGVVTGEQAIPLDSLLPGAREVHTIEELFDSWDEHVDAIRAALAQAPGGGSAGALPLAGLERLAPVAPRQVFLAGMNYRSHVVQLFVDQRHGSRPGMSTAEIRAEAERMMDERSASGVPFVFTGLPSSICGPDDEIRLRGDSSQNDWELELAAVVGRPARNVTREEALGYIAGWTIVNDVTSRDLIRRADAGPIGVDMLRAKLTPSYKPAGPYVVPAVFVPDPQKLTITLRLNGEVMQRESTGDMVFDVAQLLSYCSAQAEMLPGDLLLTGSPAGNGTHYGRFLQPGDLLEGEITGLGVQRNRCVAAGGVLSTAARVHA
jgi:2-keto-4-pentenoate hydratase/2-oxohepta-3-ene-1,7-dioic acid hydratase in catechol pathway